MRTWKTLSQLCAVLSVILLVAAAKNAIAASINVTAVTSGGTLFDFEGFADLTNADNLFAAQGLTFQHPQAANTQIRHAPRGDWVPLSGIAVLENPNVPVSPTSMSMHFSTPKSAVEFYFSDLSPLANYVFTAFDAGNAVLESVTLTPQILFNNNRAVFIAFLRGVADISKVAVDSQTTLEFQTDYYGIDDLRLDGSAAAVPLPAALPLFASGLGLVTVLAWRRKRDASRAAV
jgi:hypothetical protein